MITAQDLVDGVRSRTNTEKTQHVTDAEILRWLNDEGDQFYNKLVASREQYVTRNTTFTLNTAFFEQEGDAFNICAPLFDYTVNNVMTSYGLPFTGPFNAPPDYYQIFSLTVRPTAPNTTGPTTFELKKNGVLTGCYVLIEDGSMVEVSTFPTDLTFQDGDTFLLIPTAGAGADWTIRVTIVAIPYVQNQVANAAQIPSDFLKPVDVFYPTGQGRGQEIFPIDSTHNTVVQERPVYEISDQLIYIYPSINPRVGPYNLRYCPRYLELVLSPTPNALIREMERFRDIIELGASAMVKVKRKMLEDAQILRSLQAEMQKDAIASIPGRRGGPKKIPMPENERRKLGYPGFPYWRY